MTVAAAFSHSWQAVLSRRWLQVAAECALDLANHMETGDHVADAQAGQRHDKRRAGLRCREHRRQARIDRPAANRPSTAWGNKGFAWVRYKDFEYFCNEAYGIYPLAKTGAVANETRLSCSIGLIEKESGNYVALQNRTQNLFSTLRPLNKGTKFKVEVSNSIECYTYVFAQDTDKSSYVLFPSTPKHSAYCGITGTRIFPRDYSMLVDAIGTKDFMARVVSKNPIDYKAINNAINNFQASTYVDKINGVLGAELIPAVGAAARSASPSPTPAR